MRSYYLMLQVALPKERSGSVIAPSQQSCIPPSRSPSSLRPSSYSENHKFLPIHSRAPTSRRSITPPPATSVSSSVLNNHNQAPSLKGDEVFTAYTKKLLSSMKQKQTEQHKQAKIQHKERNKLNLRSLTPQLSRGPNRRSGKEKNKKVPVPRSKSLERTFLKDDD